MICKPVRNSLAFYRQLEAETVQDEPRHRMHLGQYLYRAMKKHPSYATSQCDVATGRLESFGSVLERSVACARAYRALGLAPGAVVAVAARNSLDVCVPLYAALMTGVAFNGLDVLQSKEHLTSLLLISRPRIIFCDAGAAGALAGAAGALAGPAGSRGRPRLVTFGRVPDGGLETFQEFLEKYGEGEGEFVPTDIDPRATTALVCCTSGSTGLPKLADLTHVNLAPFLGVVSLATGPCADLSRQCRAVLLLAPVYWLTAGYLHLQAALLGVARVVAADPAPADIVRAVNRYRPHALAATPVLAERLLTEDMDWSCLHLFMVAGSQPPPGLLQRCDEKIGRRATMNAYGLTEAAGRVFYGGPPGAGAAGPGAAGPAGPAGDEPGCLGVPVPGIEVKLVDPESGAEARGEAPGELWIRGPTVCRGYFNSPGDTAAAFPGGWFRTGDLVRRGAAGRYHFVDRLKGLLDVFVDDVHYHVSCTEIEHALSSCPGVRAACVAGVRLGARDLACALVVPRAPGAVSAEDVVAYAKKHLPPSRQLWGGAALLPMLPLMSAGKIDRARVRQLAHQSYARAAAAADTLPVTSPRAPPAVRAQ